MDLGNWGSDHRPAKHSSSMNPQEESDYSNTANDRVPQSNRQGQIISSPENNKLEIHDKMQNRTHKIQIKKFKANVDLVRVDAR